MKELLVKSELITSVCTTKVDTHQEAIEYVSSYDKDFIKQHKQGFKYHIIENHYSDYFDIYRIY